MLMYNVQCSNQTAFGLRSLCEKSDAKLRLRNNVEQECSMFNVLIPNDKGNR